MQSGIQKNQRYQPNFINGGVRYNLEGGNWRQMRVQKPNVEVQFPLNNYQELQYAIVKKSIYTFAPSISKPSIGSLLSFNFVNQQSKQWLPDQDSMVPELRKKYALINYDGRICLFGGINQNNQYLNDFHSFCSYSNMWRPVVKQSNTILPSPRIPFILAEVNNGNLLLLGGQNETGYINDAYLLSDLCWKQLKIPNNENLSDNFISVDMLVKFPGMAYCRGQGGLYFFGGYNGTMLTNQFYFLSVDTNSLSIKIQRVTTDSGPRPCPRAHHSMQKLGETCIAVYGGYNGISNLRDFSVFDFNRQSWIQVSPLNNPLSLITQSKMYFEINAVYLIGKISQRNMIRKSILQLKFPQFEIIKSQICSNCIKRLEIKQKQQVNCPKKPFVSNGLMYNMAIQIAFPFQAMSLLLDCAQKLNATELTIKTQETNNMLTYLDIRFNGNNLNRLQYASIISHSYYNDPIALQIIDKIKLGSMRLGKTLIYISVVEQFRRVFLFSADSLIISHYHQLYAYFAYQQRIKDQWLSTQQSIMHKKFIINLLRSYFKNPSLVINSVTNHCFLIFQSNVIMTNQKIYYGELLTTPNDITQCKHNKKVQFLDSIGFQLGQDPQVSLAKYLQYIYLNPSIKRLKIQSKILQLQPNKYLQQLQKQQYEKKIKSIIKQKITLKQIEAQCNIYDVIDPQVYNKQLKGIFLYWKGRLINRLDISFGDLFWQKFYKNKYKKPFGLWTHVGVINILRGAQPKTARNQFKNEAYYNYFIRYIKKQIIGKNSMHAVVNKPEIVIDVEQQGNIGKPTKNIKREK